jgi:hypothetical protein
MTTQEETFMDINQIDNRTDSDMDALERNWFAAYRAAEAARAELQTAGVSENGARVVSDILARLEKAERQKHQIMRQIHAMEDSLID